ncbi:MAG: LysR family cys regulon transcriptional activator [Enterobacterales bacterium]|jgi:LysR family cys regulon transcriptional activator
MKLQQLKYLVAIEENNLSISRAAEKIFTSQPGISKQLRLLEEELDCQIFSRNGKQLVSVTPLGTEIIHRSRNILQEMNNIKRLSSEKNITTENTTISLATTQTQAKYVLPSVFTQFHKIYKNLKIEIEQGSTEQTLELLSKDKVDFAIISGNLNLHSDIIKIPCYQWHRLVIFPLDHPLGELKNITLKDIAQYPLITYNMKSKRNSTLIEAAEAENLDLNILFTAQDADVIKTYVRSGMGVGIIASMALDTKADNDLIGYSTKEILARSTTWLIFKKGTFIPTYMKDFVKIFAPHISHEIITSYLAEDNLIDATQDDVDEQLPMHEQWDI